MRVSLAWIKRLLGVSDFGLPEEQLRARIGLSVTEIAGHQAGGPSLDAVVVGRVLTCEAHPNADRLRLTTCDIGQAEPLRIVCGAPNVAVGQTVAVAMVGATVRVTGKQGATSTLTIRPVEIRGQPSQGMICAEDELGLGPSHDGVLLLSEHLRPGTPLASALGIADASWEIENHAITHRPDLWGQLGWSRELAAACALAGPATPDIGWNDRGSIWSLAVEDEGCTTYCAAVVEAVNNRPSPAWMQKLLESCGVRPLGLLVDITNFVMLELGEPMHAFDLRCLRGTRIGVRSARDGELFTTLDGLERTLAAGDLLILDAEGPIALAGIMGGMGSMIREDTTTVVFEAAIFRPERIRRTRQRTGLATDSSARFEKGLHAELAPAAINRALALLEELCPGCRIIQRLHHGPLQGEQRTLTFHPAQVERLTGLAVEPAVQRGILERLGFTVRGDQVLVPWWRRKDIHVAADLVEEIARHHGYQRILPTIPRLPAEAPPLNVLRSSEHRARAALSARGWDEVATYSLTSEVWVEALALAGPARIHVAHPLSSEQTVLRPNLLPGLLSAVANNRKHLGRLSIYEIGRRYGRGEGLRSHPVHAGASGRGEEDEELVLAGVCAGEGLDAPYYQARDALLGLLEDLRYRDAIRICDVGHACPPWLVEARTRTLSAMLHGAEHIVGFIGEISPAIRSLAGAPEHVGYFSLRLELLVAGLGLPRPVRFIPPSRFQKVEREFTWVCPEAVRFEQLAEACQGAGGAQLVALELVTVYRGDPIPAGQKAVSLRLGFQDAQRTLEERDLQTASERIVQAVGQATGATLRA